MFKELQRQKVLETHPESGVSVCARKAELAAKIEETNSGTPEGPARRRRGGSLWFVGRHGEQCRGEHESRAM